MHFNPYGGAAAQMAATLVNLDRDCSPERLLDVLRTLDYKPVGTLDAGGARALLDWARRLERVFDDPRGTVGLVNELLAETATRPHISTHDGRPPHLHFAPAELPTQERVRAYTAAGVAHAVCDAPDRLGRCAAPGCAVVYVDTSRNGRRRFCSTRCANRVHVSLHRSRRGADEG
ncbi:CGNR zinc finger domain-containing protein [Actinosynnema pretiosum]|uniref:Zinc finger CGNR domain-containing protein n=1 Tax=Actinosynnema pretiosum TaxID=42197 RepID=A0A290Z789_9PSEU|nr:CGNR zinc finger domain-containing protein [Actinosynnema pretiosum]ATE54839.1 hypothetical protein CNX65_17415 [Actinosynnema pretiosum]